MRDRLAAWVVLGPLGHLAGGVLDWLELLARYAWSRVQRPAKRRRAPSA